jgi:glycosyltransferase involved in cell wall biosynthesis
MRVLLVTHAFPPYNASGAVRTGKFASYLAETGHDVRVLTARPLPFPATFEGNFPPEFVIATRWLDPARMVSRAADPQSAQDQPQRGRLRRAGAALAVPDAQIGWYPFAVSAGRALLRRWRPDIVYASSPPFTGHLVARRVARMAGVPWIAEFRDLFAANPYSNAAPLRAAFDRWIERKVVASAVACVTVSEPMAETLRRLHRKPVIVALNGFDPRDIPAEAAHAPPPDGPLGLLYTGIIYPGRRDPSALFEAIASLGPDAGIEVVFRGHDLRGVAALAARFGLAGCVHALPPVPHRDALAAQAQADVLLLLLWSDPSDAGAYTGKLFEYVGAGRPILAVGRTDGVAVELIRSRGLGVAAADARDIAGALRQWLAEKRATGRVASPPSSAKRGLSRQDQFAGIAVLLADVVSASGSPRLAPAAAALRANGPRP